MEPTDPDVRSGACAATGGEPAIDRNAATDNPAVFLAYYRLLDARSPKEKVQLLEALYREGWRDGVKAAETEDPVPVLESSEF